MLCNTSNTVSTTGSIRSWKIQAVRAKRESEHAEGQKDIHAEANDKDVQLWERAADQSQYQIRHEKRNDYWRGFADPQREALGGQGDKRLRQRDRQLKAAWRDCPKGVQ